MTPDQVKAARALLGWTLPRLSARSGTSIYMLQMFEQNRTCCVAERHQPDRAF
jgi:transcriptional regulator with XRE-family HTH domain